MLNKSWMKKLDPEKNTNLEIARYVRDKLVKLLPKNSDFNLIVQHYTADTFVVSVETKTPPIIYSRRVFTVHKLAAMKEGEIDTFFEELIEEQVAYLNKRLEGWGHV